MTISPAAGIDLVTAARLPAEDVLQRLQTSDQGLITEEAVARLAIFGPNQLASHRVTAFGVFGRQLRNPLLILLLSAAAVSALTGDTTDGGIIAVIVVLSVGLGFVNEYRSEVAVAALHANILHEALVWRDAQQVSVDVRKLVPGDVIALRVGDLVPADVRLLETAQLECDESVLTGESLPAPKSVAAAETDSAVDLPSCAFLGTVVHQGSGRAVVVSTGSATAFGKIAVGLGERQTETAFQVGLRGFSKLLVRVAAALTVSIFVINVAFSRPILDALLFSLAIAIGITPQLLPAIVSVSLSAGSRQLARQRVLVKRLVTIEDLGNIEVLFTDKTGTITEGAITFDRALDPSGQAASAPLLLGLVCNEATMTADGPVGGNALDAALWRSSAAAELARQADGPSSYEHVGAVPFDHDRQLASVLARQPDGSTTLTVKGAPESILASCIDLPTAVTGSQLEGMDDDAVGAAIPNTTVFARVSPEQKARIIKVARRTGVDVAFLGDGVNDAIALHAADVGISVESATDVAKDAADIVLLDKDLGVLAEGVMEGRRIFANTLKYVLMASSSNFGNMFSAAGASLFLSFLPMLPSQILLNNLLYDVGQLAIPTDRVDDEVLARPAAWDIAFVRRFMSVFGPISSIFDFATFFVMLRLLHASHDEFRSGWFVESLATQTLVVFLIRTRRIPFFRSSPSLPMILTPIACATIGAVLPSTPLAKPLGFTALPISFFLILSGMVCVYLLLVELAKSRFYATRPTSNPHR